MNQTGFKPGQKLFLSIIKTIKNHFLCRNTDIDFLIQTKIN